MRDFDDKASKTIFDLPLTVFALGYIAKITRQSPDTDIFRWIVTLI